MILYFPYFSFDDFSDCMIKENKIDKLVDLLKQKNVKILFFEPRGSI